MSILHTLNAGYLIRGITITPVTPDIRNYTLTFDVGDRPISIGSMFTPYALGSKNNSIVVVHANSNMADIFPVVIPGEPEANYNIEVWDCHLDLKNEVYVLCGSRGVGLNTQGFVAQIDLSFTSMRFIEYPETQIFYSIWADNPSFAPPLDYYAVGIIKDKGVAVSINRSTLQLTNFYITESDWHFHKIIAKQNVEEGYLLFVVSGRNPNLSEIGIFTFEPLFFNRNTYSWLKNTEFASHCVVSDYAKENDKILLASSYERHLSLYPITLPIPPWLQINEYQFLINTSLIDWFCVRDIGTIPKEVAVSICIAGFVIKNGIPLEHLAWHGNVTNLSTSSIMRNNYFYTTIDEQYESYKIRFDQNNEAYTGGYFYGYNSMGVLFGTPLNYAPLCDNVYYSINTSEHPHTWSPFNVLPKGYDRLPVFSQYWYEDELLYEYECSPFRGIFTPEFLISQPEKESEITTLYDHIIVKDAPLNFLYQIFSITGQLIQTGTINPYISTAQLSKGMYILRLENGKAFKFVK